LISECVILACFPVPGFEAFQKSAPSPTVGVEGEEGSTSSSPAPKSSPPGDRAKPPTSKKPELPERTVSAVPKTGPNANNPGGEVNLNATSTVGSSSPPPPIGFSVTVGGEQGGDRVDPRPVPAERRHVRQGSGSGM
jgi:hypothetical protein